MGSRAASSTAPALHRGTIDPVTWVLWVLAAAIIGGCAVVVVGRGGAMAEAYDDRRDVLIPSDRPLTSVDLRTVRFTTAFRGYRMAEVDALLARLAAELDQSTLPSTSAVTHRGSGHDPQQHDDVTAAARRDPPSQGSDSAG